MERGQTLISGFFQHTACPFFPCHNVENPAQFNCLFCYCPLYALGPDCGGDLTYTEGGAKDCSNCLLPHRRDSLKYIEKRLPLIMKLAGKPPTKE